MTISTESYGRMFMMKQNQNCQSYFQIYFILTLENYSFWVRGKFTDGNRPILRESLTFQLVRGTLFKLTPSSSHIFFVIWFWFRIFFGIVICIAIVIGCHRWLIFFNSFGDISCIRLGLTGLGQLNFAICRTSSRTIFLRARSRFFDRSSVGRSRLRPFFDGFYEVTTMWYPCGCHFCCH